MKQKDKSVSPQVYYLDRWVDQNHFRAFVYNAKNEQKLAKNYEEFIALVSSGLWYESKESVEAHASVENITKKRVRKSKNVPVENEKSEVVKLNDFKSSTSAGM